MSNPGPNRYRARSGRDLSEKEKRKRAKHRQKHDPDFAERQGALPAPPKKKKEKRGCIVM
jgi:hypothetical protein